MEFKDFKFKMFFLFSFFSLQLFVLVHEHEVAGIIASTTEDLSLQTIKSQTEM
jgi:hypothetical protein